VETNEPDNRYEKTAQASDRPVDGRTYYEKDPDGCPTIHYNGAVYRLRVWGSKLTVTTEYVRRLDMDALHGHRPRPLRR
jgi:hypothetical protein